MEYENEITVEVSCSLKELQDILENNNFKIVNEYDLNDIYMVEKNNVKEVDSLELLKKCVLIRDIIQKGREKKLITYKYKEYNEDREIVRQGNVNCIINSIKEAKQLFEAINYEELIKINDHLIIYSNGVDEFAVQLVNDKHIYIEIEEKCNYADKMYKNIDEMKNVVIKYNIPILDNNYFVKKAEIEVEEKNR